MKHNYTNEQLQAAIDEAFAKGYKAETHRFFLSPTSFYWDQEAPNRLTLIKAALAALPEPESSLSQLRPLAEAAEPADPYAELKAAHAAGKIIEQIGHGSSDWFGCGSSIAWSRPPECYRIKPEPKTFEAHGKTWTHHTPGDPMPCDGELKIYCIGNTKGVTHGAYPANWWAWSKQSCIIGWRYADDPLVTKPISLPLAESMSLRDWFAGQALAGSDEFSQILSMSVYKIADAMLKAREVKP